MQAQKNGKNLKFSLRSIVAKFFAALFSRLVLTAVAILIQFFYLFFLAYQFTEYAGYIETGARIIGLMVAFYIVYMDQNPAYKIAWLVLIAVLPEMGTILFLLYGNRRPQRVIARRTGPVKAAHREDLQQVSDLGNLTHRSSRRLAQYVRKYGPYPAWDNTRVRYFGVGDTFFASMVKDLQKAERFIFLEYFIIAKGSLWDEIFAILKEKAAQGVDVRVIYDDVGSMGKLPRHFAQELRRAGIRVMAFNTMRPILSLVYNTRDHRKIAVIDGEIGYNGGANIADEYVNRIVRFGHWKDSGVRLEGAGVWNLTVMFLNMWNAFEKEADVSYLPYRPRLAATEKQATAAQAADVSAAERTAQQMAPAEAAPAEKAAPAKEEPEGLVMPFSDTPVDAEELGRNIYLDIINHSERYIYIMTPYLIPDTEIESALKLAAKRGIDVRIIVPGIPDKPGVFAVTQSFYRTLMGAGVRIYEYAPGFVHAKNFISDDRVGVVGTVNLDFRSLYLHFECGTVLLEHREGLTRLREAFMDTFATSRRVVPGDLKLRPFSSIYGFFARVLSPLL